MEGNVQLSVIIPMYRGKEYIQQAVESVLPVSCSKEILIVDDGSPDDSMDFCRSLWAEHKEIVLLQKENGGIVETRNYGIDRARGKYLLFMDQDDLSVPATVEMAVETAEQTHADMVMFSTQRLYEDGNRLPCDTVLQPGLLETAAIKTELLDQMLMNTGNTVVSCITHVWANLYRRERVVQWGIRFKRFVDYEDDYLFVFDYLRCAQKVAVIKPVGYYWRYNLKSETYRQKYIPGIVQRYENWYRYMLRCMDETGWAEGLREQYLLYIRQDVLVRAVENCFTCLNRSKEEKKELLAIIHGQKDAFRKSSVVAYSKRRKRIFMLLQKGLPLAAYSYVYLDSVYRKLRRMLVS